MSLAGPKLLSATSLVGARIVNSADRRQFRIRQVSMIDAARPDLKFFFGSITNHSLMSLRPLCGSYAPKMVAARSNTH
ncbi:hypothetical protein D3C71_1330590 [compost metagenome]